MSYYTPQRVDYHQAPAQSQCHSRQRLREFLSHSSKFRMQGESDVRQYYRQFLRLSKPLFDSYELTRTERNNAFWYGFHPEDQNEIFSQLIAQYPMQPRDTAFDLWDVYEVAQVISTKHNTCQNLEDFIDRMSRLNDPAKAHFSLQHVTPIDSVLTSSVGPPSP
ncbi:hypothetical protein BC826DRAFT_973531 [Russula brevipes]|nr:hypothetical protein BC826DRAFT_973531 [Russula brevipes]